MPSARSWTASKRAESTSLMQAVKKRSHASRRDDCVGGAPVGRRVLASGFPLRRSDQQIDQRIDRIRLRKIDTALEGRLDQTTDDFRPADCLAMLQTDVDGETIEVGDVAIEKDDGDFGPGLRVDNRTATIALCRTHAHLSSVVVL